MPLKISRIVIGRLAHRRYPNKAFEARAQHLRVRFQALRVPVFLRLDCDEYIVLRSRLTWDDLCSRGLCWGILASVLPSGRQSTWISEQGPLEAGITHLPEIILFYSPYDDMIFRINLLNTVLAVGQNVKKRPTGSLRHRLRSRWHEAGTQMAGSPDFRASSSQLHSNGFVLEIIAQNSSCQHSEHGMADEGYPLQLLRGRCGLPPTRRHFCVAVKSARRPFPTCGCQENNP